MNPLLLIDGYKLDHRRQYPPNTQSVYSNLTARASRIPGQEEVVFLGLQYFLRHFLMDELKAFSLLPQPFTGVLAFAPDGCEFWLRP